jgi:hypothetical protein
MEGLQTFANRAYRAGPDRVTACRPEQPLRAVSSRTGAPRLNHRSIRGPRSLRRGVHGPVPHRHPEITIGPSPQAEFKREESTVDQPAGYLHVGFIVISYPNLGLILAMVLLFVVALLAPFPNRQAKERRP